MIAEQSEMVTMDRTNTRIINFLGSEMFVTDVAVLYELVKNAYDADASEVSIRFNHRDHEGQVISIRDNGTGMRPDQLADCWFAMGSDHKAIDRTQGRKSERFGRIPLGQEGLARFGTQRVGTSMRVVTRAEGSPEIESTMDWDVLMRSEFLSDFPISVDEVKPTDRIFPDHTGTQVEVSGLRRPWNTTDFQDLSTHINFMTSRVSDEEFKVTLEGVPEECIAKYDTPRRQIVERSPWKFRFRIEDDRFSFEYTFDSPNSRIQDSRSISRTIGLESLSSETDLEVLCRIGPIEGNLHIFHKDVSARLLQTKGIKNLGPLEGIKVYRNGFRVYPYGEVGDFWLTEDIPDKGLISGLAIAGEIHLQGGNDGLDETLAKSGFRNSQFSRQLRDILREAVLWFWNHFEEDHDYGSSLVRNIRNQDLAQDIEVLESALAETGISSYYTSLLTSMENENDLLLDLLQEYSSAATWGMTFHDLEKAVGAIYYNVRRNPNASPEVIDISGDLDELMLLPRELVRRMKSSSHSVQEVFQYLEVLYRMRFKRHEAEFICPLLMDRGLKFEITGRITNILGVVEILVDNALYWSGAEAESGGNALERQARIYLGTASIDGQNAIVIADNGPGFKDEPEILVQPGFTRRLGRKGNGLYLADKTMKTMGGALLISAKHAVKIPEEFCGAVVAATFPN